jgi:hypothetical protein
MEPENEKFRKIINLLKRSEPVLKESEQFTEVIINRIKATQQKRVSVSDIIEYLFRWVYIGWVRRSLVTTSFILVFVFVYQQALIIKQVSNLSKQLIVSGGEYSFDPSDKIEGMITTYKLSVRKFSPGTFPVSKKQMEEFLNSFNELQIKYKDLINIIEEDAELKKLIEEKLEKRNNEKLNL